MAVTRRTLRLVARLRRVVGSLADDTVRDLTRSWVSAWDRLAGGWREAASDLAALAQRLERWPGAWDTARVGSVQSSLQATAAELDALVLGAVGAIGDAAEQAIRATVEQEPGIIGSQLPRAYPVRHPMDYAVAAIVTRTRQQITAQTQPLSADAQAVLRRELVRGVALGQHPNKVAAEIVSRVDGAFNGGATRAATVSRTEILDAHRAASRQIHTENADVLDSWRWLATTTGRSAGRTCISCWSMNGRTFPVTDPGPLDHVQGRCARVPVTRSWAELGIPGNEPADDFPDARAIFAALPRDKQIAVMGPARHALWAADDVTFNDMATLRTNPGWRPSYTPTSVADLRRIADSRRTAA